MSAFVYILECANRMYYTGSTTDINKRMMQHQSGEGANFTRKFLPVKLVFLEEFMNINQAFEKEKQIQEWSRAKKKALIDRNFDKLILLSRNYSEFGKFE